jgi:hypothetical protein
MLGREEFEEAHRGALAGAGDQRRDSRRSNNDQVPHDRITVFQSIS